MNNQNIVLTKISGTVTDITSFCTDIDHIGKSITLAPTDAIYIGSVFPFNSLYLRFGAAVSNNASVLTASFWDAVAFTDFYKTVDGTDLSGAAFGKSGIINIIAKDDKLPACYDSRNIPEIDVDGYYSLYWTRLKVSATTDAVTLAFVGQCFLDLDSAIYRQYPDLASSQYFRVYGTKSDWLDQRLIASDCLISDLITMNQITTGDQFLDWRLLKEPTLHKTAELIYKAQGMKYREDMLSANKSYLQSLQSRKWSISKSGNIIKTRDTYARSEMGFYR
jgi:hypothetical protein